MRTVAAIAVCVALNLTCIPLAVAGDQPQAASAPSTPAAAASIEELHFVSVLTLHGEVAGIEPAKRLVTLKGPKGDTLTLEARSKDELKALKAGDHVVARYFEGARITKKKPGEAAGVTSLKDGIVDAEAGAPSRKKHTLIASVETVDAVNQEVTIKAPDGSIETIMVVNPEALKGVKAGDQVAITRAQALAISLAKES